MFIRKLKADISLCGAIDGLIDIEIASSSLDAGLKLKPGPSS